MPAEEPDRRSVRGITMNVSAPFIVRPIATTLLMIGVTLLGLVAYFILPIAGVPQVDVPTIRVSASLPGANAETMATSVAAPLETQLSLISGVTAISSTSSLGQTQIQVEFDLGRSLEGAAQDVQTAISAAGGLLPKNLPNPPTYEKINPADALVDVDRGHLGGPPDLQGRRVWSRTTSRRRFRASPGSGSSTITASRSRRSAFRSTRWSLRPWG